jgi:hypothetical protein
VCNQILSGDGQHLIVPINLLNHPRLFQEFLKRQFDHGKAHSNLAFCLQEIGDWKGAAYHHKEASIWFLEPKYRASSISNYVYVHSYADLSNLGSATILNQHLQLLHLALDIDPNNPDALFRLGHTYNEGGYIEQSLQAFTRLVHHHPNSTLGYLNIGNHYYRQNRFYEAEKTFLKLIQLCQQNLLQISQQETSTSEVISPDGGGRKVTSVLAMAYSNLGSTYRICDQLPPSLVAYTNAFRYSQFANDFMSLLFPLFGFSRPLPLYPTLFTQLISIPSLPQITLSPSPYLVSNSDAWGLSNIMAVNGLLCNWQHLELLESLINYVVNTVEAGKYSVSQDSSSDSVAVDSYSFMLVR